ncbi:MAG TPA: pitrilysin family protein [Vicinamibacteria bacterium]|nr:pitrilysin family protein [Vicinamibacteria bacterium]
MNVRSAVLCAAVLLGPPLLAAEKPGIEVAEFTLPNGMRWLLFERHESPTINAGWVAHVGSVNEREGITGISHLFEHMMFKGTRTLGTRDIEKDLALLAEIEEVRAQMRVEMEAMRARLRRGEITDILAPEAKTARYQELEKRYDELVARHREIVVKDHIDQLYTRNGGQSLNAGTWEDLTAYFVTVPSNRLELWSWIESDRLLNPVFREFYSERDVVHEERRRSTEATPLGKYDEAFNALFWEAAPYKWPVVGWASDLLAISKADADQYFATYYAPNNLTGVLVGDFRTAEARAMVERYFGRIPRGKTDPPPVVTREPKQLAEKRYHAEADTAPTVRIWWHSVPFVHRDRSVVDLLSDVLSGRTGRLYKGLVEGRQLANAVQASVDLKKYAGIFQVEAVVKDGQDPAAVEKAIEEELRKLADQEVPPAELQKVKNQAKANAFRRLSSQFFIALQLMYYDGLGDWRYINSYADEIDKVTAADLQRAARETFTRENRTVGVFLRKAAAAPEVAK